ncbi:MAG: hypothetical protein EHM44_02160 [Ignavibacteriales bacterium]|nr:MAG: hypothetical protein EHM44_02160 [Ignavibacteriales bacterium]
MLKIIKNGYRKLAVFSFAVLGMFGLASAGLCAPSSTPEEVLDTVVSSGIDTVTGLVTTVVTTWFPYIIVFSIIVALFVWLRRFASTGTK